MRRQDESWVGLVDGPIAALVDRVLAEHADLAALVATPARRLAFRTFAVIRVGIVLGEALVETEVEDQGAWVDELAARPELKGRLEAELRAVAERVAADPALAEEAAPKIDPRERFRALVRDAGA